MEEGRVYFADGVEAPRADETPDHGGGVDGAALGAGEAIVLVVGADIFDIIEDPGGDADLGEGAEDLLALVD